MSEGTKREGLLLPILIPLGALAVIGAVLFGFSRILLAISHDAATVVAITVAVAILTIASVVAARPRVTGGSLLSMVGASAGVAMMVGGLAVVAVGPEKEAEGGQAQVVALAAPEGAAASGFDTDHLAVAAGEPIALEFDNADPNVAHNVVIFDGKDADAPELFSGELITGPAKATYQVPALEPGSYFFHCEVHPGTMNGVIDAGEGGGGGGPTLVAKDLAFDTDTIRLPADTATTLTFDNQDANTPHNFAIYEDDSATTPLFQGDIVTGPDTAQYKIPAIPAGEYYFQCDVHPNMNGTVVVGEPAGGGGGDGGGGGGPTQTPTAPPSDTGASATASIAAAGLQFDTTTLSFPANEPVILTFDDQDDVNTTGPHNVAIYTDDTLAEPLFQGELVNGPATVEYQVPPLEAGEYYFHCDVHPTMSGTVTVS